MTLTEDIEKYFDTKNLYEVLNVDKGASKEQIKKAYRKTSLKVHPDRVGESQKEEATRKFQVLSQVHFVLNDEERRKLYDEHGIISNESGLDEQADWVNYWRLLFPKVTEKDINTFYDKYIGSEEEEKDLIAVYNKWEGDLDKISDSHIGYDEERSVSDLKRLIGQGKIEAFDKFINEPAAQKNRRLKKYKKEARDAEKAKAESNTGFDELSAMIRQKNNNSFENMLSNLEAKYANKSQKGTKRKRSNRD